MILTVVDVSHKWLYNRIHFPVFQWFIMPGRALKGWEHGWYNSSLLRSFSGIGQNLHDLYWVSWFWWNLGTLTAYISSVKPNSPWPWADSRWLTLSYGKLPIWTIRFFYCTTFKSHRFLHFLLNVLQSRSPFFKNLSNAISFSFIDYQSSIPKYSDPSKAWRHFEDPKTPLRHTGSNPSIGGSNHPYGLWITNYKLDPPKMLHQTICSFSFSFVEPMATWDRHLPHGRLGRAEVLDSERWKKITGRKNMFWLSLFGMCLP